MRNSPAKGKGKHRFILPEESEDEEELFTRATKILEDATKNNIIVEKQFQ